MKQILVDVVKYEAKLVDGKPVLDKEQKTLSRVVASTKSQNIAIKELQNNYDSVKLLGEKDLFLPKEFVSKCIENVNDYIKDEKIALQVKTHIADVLLNLGCIVKKEK